MPSLFISSCNSPKKILEVAPILPPHNWLISYVDTLNFRGYDYTKWEKPYLIMSDEEFTKEIFKIDPQFFWAVFSAIPTKYTTEEILSFPLPELETSYYMNNHIVPQHPLAFFEIAVWDGGSIYVTSHDKELLKPFFNLPNKIQDEEEANRILNKILCRIQDVLREMIPEVSDSVANEIQWRCWHELFRGKKAEVRDEKLKKTIKKHYEFLTTPGNKPIYGSEIWNPYEQK